MEKEWVDVVDNVVKIGLPSIITGFITIFGMKYSAKSTQNKFMLEHKVKVLEKLSDDVDVANNAWNRLCSKYGAITKKMDHDSDNIVFNDPQLKIIKERDKQLSDVWGKRESAIVKLRLLKANNAVEKLNEYINLQIDFRDLIIFSENYPNYNEFSELRRKVSDAEREFHKELSDFYESIAS